MSFAFVSETASRPVSHYRVSFSTFKPQS